MQVSGLINFLPQQNKTHPTRTDSTQSSMGCGSSGSTNMPGTCVSLLSADTRRGVLPTVLLAAQLWPAGPRVTTSRDFTRIYFQMLFLLVDKYVISG